jgi:hypothetical protein
MRFRWNYIDSKSIYILKIYFVFQVIFIPINENVSSNVPLGLETQFPWSTIVQYLLSLDTLCIWLEKSEIYSVVVYILDTTLRLKFTRNRSEEPQGWGRIYEFALSMDSQNFHMVLDLIWLALLMKRELGISIVEPRRGCWVVKS